MPRMLRLRSCCLGLWPWLWPSLRLVVPSDVFKTAERIAEFGVIPKMLVGFVYLHKQLLGVLVLVRVILSGKLEIRFLHCRLLVARVHLQRQERVLPKAKSNGGELLIDFINRSRSCGFVGRRRWIFENVRVHGMRPFKMRKCFVQVVGFMASCQHLPRLRKGILPDRTRTLGHDSSVRGYVHNLTIRRIIISRKEKASLASLCSRSGCTRVKEKRPTVMEMFPGFWHTFPSFVVAPREHPPTAKRSGGRQRSIRSLRVTWH